MRASHLIVVDGQKGGVGKSTVARLLLAHLARRGVGFRAYDADGIVGDLGRYYSGVARAVDLASVSSAGVVLDDLVEGDARVWPWSTWVPALATSPTSGCT